MTDLTAADEGLRPPGPEEQWSDSFYFGGGDGQRGVALYSRVGRRPNEGRVEGALGVWLPDGRFLLAFGRGPDGGRTAAGPVAFECRSPFEFWRIDIHGRGRLYARAEDLALAPDRHEEVEVGGRLRFACWTDPIESDHSWGVRDWQSVPYWRWFGMVVDPDNFVMLNNVGTADGGESVGGCLMRDGRLAPIASGDTESELDPDLGCQRRFTARARDELGRDVELRGEAVSVAPLRQRRDGRLTLVNEGLTRLSWDGHDGLGISEYLTQRS